MKLRLVLRASLVAAVAAVLVSGAASLAEGVAGTWNQFGGPHQDFKSPATGLATSWPEDGPKKLWTRDLGDGYSGILYDSGHLYTMYRDGDDEVVLSLDAKSGETVWEHRYAAAPKENHVDQFGTGPRSTPLIDGNTIYTIGVAGTMHALAKKSGKVKWSHELWGDEFGGNVLQHGYSSSPIAHGNTIITLVGGEGAGIVAFDKKSGKVAWKSLDFENSYSTPEVMNVDGQDQLIAFMRTEIVGVDPDSGKLQWSFHHEGQWKQNINMPVMADANHLFLSSPHAGARGLKLTRNGDKTEVEELWSTRKIQFYHVTSVRDGDWVYGSTGTMAPAFLAAVNIRTGEIAWRERGFAKANVLGVDGKLLILDEEGVLALASATPEGLEVLTQATVADKVAWTVPTVIGTTVFVRDKEKIMALDLG